MGAAEEGLDALVVMWRGASEAKLAATRDYGAAVDLEAADPAEAFERLDALLVETGRTLVHPFDDLFTIAGQGTVGLEILDDLPHTETIVVPIGGGGLISGVATAAAGRARVIGVEPESSAALHSALAAGERVNVDPMSIADGLNAPYAGHHALSVAREHVEEVVLVSEEEIEDGFRFLYERAKLACEPAGAAAVAAVLAGRSGAVEPCASSRAGTSPPRRPLLSWPADEDRHPSRLRHRARDVLVRQRVLDALDEGRAPRRDLRRVSPVLYGEAEARRYRRSGGALPAPAREGRPRSGSDD